MFDLFRNREKTKKYMMGGILVMVSASMLLYLVPNYSNGSGVDDVVLAKVGGVDITEAEARRMINAQMRGGKIPVEIIPNYVPSMINDLIVNRALDYEADKLGIQVSDQDVAEALRSNYPGLFQDGKFVGKETYAAMLAQQGTTITEFEYELKRQIRLNNLRRIAAEGSVVTPAEIEAEYHKKNDQMQLQFVKISQDKFKKDAEPSNDEMLKYYQTNSARYQNPESKNLTILIADGAKIEAGLNPTDAELQMAYNQNAAAFRVPERVHERHILLMTQGKPPAEEPKQKAKAEDLVKQLRAGADFAELAKKNSEDTVSAAKGGDLDWVTRGQMVAEFEKASFELKPMVISDPVKTQYGYHIIQVLAHEDARMKPFAEAKEELTKAWKQQRVADTLQRITEQAQAAFQREPGQPEKVAAQFGMQVVHAEAVKPGGNIPEMGVNPDFDQAISGLKKGEISQAVNVGQNKVAIAQVTDIVPAHPAAFEEVKGQVHDALVNTKLAQVVQDKAKKLADEIKANGGDLAKAAKTMGLEVKTSEFFKRGGTVDGIGTANYFEDAFKAPIGTVLDPVSTPDGTVIAKVVQRQDADMSKLPEQRNDIRETLKAAKAQERFTLFETGLVEELERRGVIKMHPEVITRIISSFRSGS